MGRLGNVLNHAIDKFIELIVETRAGYNQKGFLYNSSGEDSPPIKKDRVLLVKVDGTGRNILLGVLTESQGAKPGEKIFFARDEEGEVKSTLKMLGDGDILLNGANIEISGDITAAGGSFICGGNVMPTGQGALCGCKFCYVTGAPVAGDTAQGT